VSQVLEFLGANESAAYTANELVAEIVPEESDETVVAYHRAILEALTYDGRVEKREVSADTDEADLIPYYRAAEDEGDETPATEQAQPTTREVSLDGPVRVRMADESGTVPVHIEESQSDTDSTTPFFVRWYRWYRRQSGNW
jgi:hypothetical protein